MRRVTILITTVLLITIGYLTSCGDSSNEETKQPILEGAWRCTNLSIIRNDIDNNNDKNADAYINHAFSNVVRNAKIRRVFDGKTVSLIYKDENGTEHTYYSLNYNLNNDTLRLSGDGELRKYHCSLSNTLLMTDWYTDKDILRVLLSDMGQLAPNFNDIDDNYKGRITMTEIR